MRYRTAILIQLALSVAGLVPGTEVSAQETGQRSSWTATIGAALLVVPRYSGSDQFRVLPVPLSQVSFRNRVYLGPGTTGLSFGLGAYLIRTSGFTLAAELGLQDKRPASRADALAGMEDRDVFATAGASLRYRAGPLETGVGIARGLHDGGGLMASAHLALSQRLGRLLGTIGVRGTMADARQMRREFGITESEAAERQALIDAGDDRLRATDGRAYRPDGALRTLGVSLSLVYLLSPRWSLIGFGGVDRLSDEAAASPLVRRREQYSGGIGLGYRL